MRRRAQDREQRDSSLCHFGFFSFPGTQVTRAKSQQRKPVAFANTQKDFILL